MTTYLIKGAAILGGEPTDLLLRDGAIAEIGTNLAHDGAEVIDAAGLVALPGLVDLHTHLREPGREDAETVETGTQAAALGGFTAVHAMANTDPVADTAGVVEQVWRLGREAGHCDVFPVGAVTVGLAGERLAELGAMADSAARVRVFSDDGKCVSDAVLMRRALEYVKAFDGVVAQHAQEPRLTEDAQMNEGELSGRLGLRGWPAVAEEAIIARDCLLAAHVGSRLHVCHVSTAGSVEIVRWAKAKGWDVTAEVCPHHLLLTDELAATYDPIYKVNPPLRTAADVEALRAGLADGTIDVVATDHAPHPHEDKDCEWQAAAFGMLGLETALSVVQETMVDTGLLDWAGVAERMSATPGADRPAVRPRPPDRGGRAGQRRALRPVRAPGRRRRRAGLAVAQHAVRRDGAARPGGRHVPARHPDRPRREAGVTGAAVLVLEDGRAFHGDAFGAAGETFGEAVFYTGMTGYQETLTDPSYHRQVVVMTAPHVGNTGMNDEDPESRRIWVSGYVVRDPARVASSWRSVRTLDDELREQGVVGISGIDTRALTRHLRERGAMRVGISSTETDADALLARVRDAAQMAGAELAGEVSTTEAYVVPAVGEKRFTVAAVDLGIKANTPRMMAERGIEVHVLPATVDDRRRPRGAARRAVLLQRPRRPGGHHRPGRAAQGRPGARAALLRDLLRQPALRPGARLRHLQADVRPPRHQPAGDGPHHRQGRGHRAQPRLRRRRTPGPVRPRRRTASRRSATSASTTTSSRASSCARRTAT